MNNMDWRKIVAIVLIYGWIMIPVWAMSTWLTVQIIRDIV
jgi:hypothetical protein